MNDLTPFNPCSNITSYPSFLKCLTQALPSRGGEIVPLLNAVPNLSDRAKEAARKDLILDALRSAVFFDEVESDEGLSRIINSISNLTEKQSILYFTAKVLAEKYSEPEKAEAFLIDFGWNRQFSNPDEDPYLPIGIAYVRTGQLDRATETLDLLVKFENIRDLSLQIIEQHLRVNAIDKAKELVQKAREPALAVSEMEKVIPWLCMNAKTAEAHLLFNDTVKVKSDPLLERLEALKLVLLEGYAKEREIAQARNMLTSLRRDLMSPEQNSRFDSVLEDLAIYIHKNVKEVEALFIAQEIQSPEKRNHFIQAVSVVNPIPGKLGLGQMRSSEGFS